MGWLLHDQGKLDDAESLLREAVDASSATLPEGHRTRLRAHGWLADVYRAQGKLQQARALVDERVLAAAREALGAKVDTTLMLEVIEARLRVAEGGGLEPLRAALGRMSEALGPLHPETRRCKEALDKEVREG